MQPFLRRNRTWGNGLMRKAFKPTNAKDNAMPDGALTETQCGNTAATQVEESSSKAAKGPHPAEFNKPHKEPMKHTLILMAALLVGCSDTHPRVMQDAERELIWQKGANAGLEFGIALKDGTYSNKSQAMAHWSVIRSNSLRTVNQSSPVAP